MAAPHAADKQAAIGWAGLAAGATARGLVDELRIFRHAIIVGGGTAFLLPVTGAVRLELSETRSFGSHVMYGRDRGRSMDRSEPRVSAPGGGGSARRAAARHPRRINRPTAAISSSVFASRSASPAPSTQ